jgi:hypothetical protein
MSRRCSICFEEKSSEEFPDRTYCRSCHNQKRRAKRATTSTLDVEVTQSLGNVNVLEKLMSNLSTQDNLDLSLDLLEKIRSDLISIKERKPTLDLPMIIPDAAFQYFKRCTEMGMSLTTMQNRMYVKCDEDYFKETYGVERPEFIKVSHELSFLIDYIRCLKDAYNQFIEDHNFATRHFNPDYEKIKDIQTSYNFNSKCIEMSDNPLRLDRKTFLRKLRDETQNHHGLMYFHQKGYFNRWYEQFSV